jgi:hypothetical protein
MIQKKRKVSRLTLLFIAIVFASGTILGYLSINNISNLKELTEKHIEEEQKSLVLAFSDHLHSEVIGLADGFSAYLDNRNSDREIVQNAKDTFNQISQFFLLNNKGQFIWPWFVDGTEIPTEGASNERYRRVVIAAEKAEFTEQNFAKANKDYLSSLSLSLNRKDSLYSLNALGRLSLKSKDHEQAVTYYSIISSDFHSSLDPYGFPYVYYAIPQLIKASNSSNKNRILQEIGFCIRNMNSGKIPLNQSTAIVLAQIEEWLDLEKISTETKVEFKEKIVQVRNRLAFIDRNREMLLDPSKGEKVITTINIPNEFELVKGRDPEVGELILLKPYNDLTAGFSLLLKDLWKGLQEYGYRPETEFEYEVWLEGKGNDLHPEDMFRAELSPYFPGQYIFVKLKNENIIDEIVKRRSWIYGIAFTLLLGGMILGILLILRDIRREENLARLRADFISNVTHELKTPLTSIQLFTESIVLNRLKGDAHRKEYLQIILKETQSLKRMINNILDFSRKQKGKSDYQFRKVDISLLLNEAIDDLEYWLVEKNFSLHKEIEESIIGLADPEALKQVIINLLNNAIKFSLNRKEMRVHWKGLRPHPFLCDCTGSFFAKENRLQAENRLLSICTLRYRSI